MPPSSASASTPPPTSRPSSAGRSCATLPVAAALPALLALGIGAIVFRLRRLRGELFALLTLSVTFVIATIILNTPIDGGGGIFMSAVPLPDLMPTPTGTIYLLGFILCVATPADRLEGRAFAARHGPVRHPRRRGRGRGQGRADPALQADRLRAVRRRSPARSAACMRCMSASSPLPAPSSSPCRSTSC